MQRAKQEIQRKKWDEDLRRLHTEALELIKIADKPNAE